jgi:hypothetical protein
MIDEIILLLQQQQAEITKLLNQHNREIVALLIEMKEDK